MKEIQRILSHVRRAVADYDMIKEGDRVCVGVSAGKDSLTLLAALAEMRRFYPKKYEIVAITIDMGFDGVDWSEVSEFCRRLKVEYRVVKTDIAKIIFDVRKEPNPCSLCAKMRRGSLHAEAQAAGCNKVALGHHMDDAAETFMMNLLNGGHIGCFSPVTYLSRKDIHVIRPMIFCRESEPARICRRMELPIVKSRCPADGVTERESMKQLLSGYEKKYGDIRSKIIGAMQRKGIDGWGYKNEED